MKILMIWQDDASNPGGAICSALRELGHTTHLLTNAVPSMPAGMDNEVCKKHAMDGMPLFDLPITHEEVCALEAERDERNLPDDLNYMMSWDYVARRWSELEKGVPDAIFIWESPFTVGSAKPQSWRGIPVLYYGLDNGRGADHEMRQAHVAGATHMLVTTRWHMPFFQIKRHIRGIPYRGGFRQSGRYFDKVYWLPLCANPDVFHPYPDAEKQFDVLFMGQIGLRWYQNLNDEHSAVIPPPFLNEEGSFYLDDHCKYDMEAEHYNEMRQRARFAELLMKETAFKFHYRPSKFGEPYGRELASARIIWNCQGGYEATTYGTSNRVFQGTAVGSVLVTNETDEVTDFFTPDKEIATYRTSFCPWHHLFEWFDYGLLRDRIMDILGDPQKQRDMAEASVERTRKHHLPIHRAQRIARIAAGEEVDPETYL
jgi:hypothetical protein